MPRNGSGTYTLPEASFVPGTVISSSAMNSDLSDIALALTGSVAADGQTPFTGPFQLPDGSPANPSITFTTHDTDGIYHPDTGEVGFALDGEEGFLMQAPSATVGSGLTGADGAVLLPLGTVWDFAGSTAPSGWFLCYGQAISRTTYSELFTVIGTTYGAGDSSTTYNLPDLRGRSISGKDNMGGSAAGRITSAGSGIDGLTLGASGGTQTHALTVGELAAHSHSGTSDDQSNDHTHTQIASTSIGSYSGGGSNGPLGFGSQTGGTSQGHTHTFTTNDAGSNTAHQNMQPTMIMNKIIFAGHP